MDCFTNITHLSVTEFWILAAIVFVAGIVRGFSGFALSALIMATAITILPPVELIPMLWWLELSASFLMLKGGWADANKAVTFGLVIGSACGWPIGLWLTTTLDVDISRIVALSIIVGLAIAQLAKVRLDFLNNKPGLYGTGIIAGITSGLANVGGMVVAFYVLASDAPAKTIRASLVLFLFLGSFTSMIALVALGVMDWSGISRGLVFAVPTMLGVLVGQLLFSERLGPYYRPFCLSLLVGLAGVGLIRQVST